MNSIAWYRRLARSEWVGYGATAGGGRGGRKKHNRYGRRRAQPGLGTGRLCIGDERQSNSSANQFCQPMLVPSQKFVLIIQTEVEEKARFLPGFLLMLFAVLWVLQSYSTSLWCYYPQYS
jgi:hypothetical protein